MKKWIIGLLAAGMLLLSGCNEYHTTHVVHHVYQPVHVVHHVVVHHTVIHNTVVHHTVVHHVVRKPTVSLRKR